MTDSRWIIARRLLLLILVGTGVALAARRGKDPAPSEAVPPPTPPVEQAPALPVAAPLFPAALPISLQAVPDGLPSLSAQACGACHVAVHAAWAQGPHARAWNAPAFRAALARAGDATACSGCHLPLANQHPRLAAAYVQGDIGRPELAVNPAWEPSLMIEGVTCAACHIRDGMVLTGDADAGPAPHPLAYSRELAEPAARSELCATCHQLTWPGADKPFYDTYGEWKQSPQAQAGLGCTDCHMAPTPGVAMASDSALQADHAFPAVTGRALSVLVTVGSPELTRGTPFPVKIRLQNTGAGHHLPTGSPFKRYRVLARLLDADGKEIAPAFSSDLVREVEGAPPWTTLSDNRLPAGQERILEHAFTVDQKKKAGRGTLQVGIWRIGAEVADPARWTPPATAVPLVLHEIPLPVL